MDLVLVFFSLMVILASSMMLFDNWRIILALLGGVYLFGALMLQPILEFTYVVIFLISGWLAISILVVAQMNCESTHVKVDDQNLLNRFFRLFSILPILILSGVLTPQLIDIFDELSFYPTMLFIFFFGFSIMMSGFSIQPIRYIVSMLLFFLGFFVLYVSIDNSIFVIGILAFVQLALAIVGAYLILVGELDLEGAQN